MTTHYAPSFLRQFRKLEPSLQEEVLHKIGEFKKLKDWSPLKIHKLHGKLREEYAFSVNYRIRIRFVKKSASEYWFLRVGTHPIYEE